MDSGHTGYEDELRARVAYFERRFTALQEEHRLALNMLQDACQCLSEIREENMALRMQWQYLQSNHVRLPGSPENPAITPNSWTSALEADGAFAQIKKPLDADVPMPSLLAGCTQKSLATSNDNPHAAPWPGLHSPGSRAASNSDAVRHDRDLHQAVQPMMPPGFAAPHQSLSQGRQFAHEFVQLPDSAQMPLRPRDPGQISSSVVPIRQHRQPSSQLSEKANRKAFEPWMTTIVVRNIPARYTQERLLEVWEPDGSYNFFYLPYSVKQKRGSGYVFINFGSHQAARDFWHRVQGTRLPGCEHLKNLDVAVADIQGLENNLRYWGSHKLSRISNSSFLPMVFSGTRRVDFKEQVAACKLGGEATRRSIR